MCCIKTRIENFTAKRIVCLVVCILMLCLCACSPRFPASPLTAYAANDCIKAYGNADVGMYEEYQNIDAPQTRVFVYKDYRAELSYADSARRSYVSYDMDRYEGVLDGIRFTVDYRQNTDEVCGVSITPENGNLDSIFDVSQTEAAYWDYIQHVINGYGVNTAMYNERSVTTEMQSSTNLHYTTQSGFLEASDLDAEYEITQYRFEYYQIQNGVRSCDNLNFVFFVKTGGLWFRLDTEPLLTGTELSSTALEQFTDENIKNAIAHWTIAQNPNEKTWIWDVSIEDKVLFWHEDAPALFVWAVRYEKSGIGKGLEAFVLPIRDASGV